VVFQCMMHRRILTLFGCRRTSPILGGYTSRFAVAGLANPGTVSICLHDADITRPCTSAPVAVLSYPYWSDQQVNALLDVSNTPPGTYDVILTSGGVSGTFVASPGIPQGSHTWRAAFQVSAAAPVSIKLEKVGPTVIGTDGKYSEDTTIQVTAVRSDTGATITDFVGTVNIAEDGTAIYSLNGSTLPPSVNIMSGGTAMIVAKSLAGPKVEGAQGAAARCREDQDNKLSGIPGERSRNPSVGHLGHAYRSSLKRVRLRLVSGAGKGHFLFRNR
jgi:hypothetical protein